MCSENKWSETSVKAMIAYFGTEEKQGKLCMAILKTATCGDADIPLCKAAYTSEGDLPLIFTAAKFVSRLENQLGNGLTKDFPYDLILWYVSKIIYLL